MELDTGIEPINENYKFPMLPVTSIQQFGAVDETRTRKRQVWKTCILPIELLPHLLILICISKLKN